MLGRAVEEHGISNGARRQGDDDGRIVWFNLRIPLSTILTHALCRGRGFIGNWRESIERRQHRLKLH
jgi:hypothetical protein